MKIYSSDELSNEQYHAMEGISGSGLAAIHNKSVSHYLAEKDVGEPTDAMRLGTIIHTAILEPEVFKKEYACGIDEGTIPENALRTTNDIKAHLRAIGCKMTGTKSELIERVLFATPEIPIYDEIIRFHNERCGDREVVPYKQYNEIQAMKEALYANEENARLLTGAKIENSVIDCVDGVTVKCRPDAVSADGWVINYKTTVDAHPDRFISKAIKLGYLLRAAVEFDLGQLLFDGTAQGYMLIVQEKTAPYQTVRYVFGHDELAVGRKQYQSALQRYVGHMIGDKDSYVEQLDFTLPEYYYDVEDELIFE